LTVGPQIQVPAVSNDPTTPNSPFVLGGNKSLQLNLEIEFPIFEKAGFRGVVFLDTGNAYNDNHNFFYAGTPTDQWPDLYLIGSCNAGRCTAIKSPVVFSAGFGIRWFSPIGPLRFEWGIPFTKVRPYDQDLVFEFTIGNFF
jgi:outer membrane protein insertion porin family